MTGYAAASLALIGVYVVLPSRWRGLALVAVCVGAAGCVVLGRRAVRRGRRAPWTLLLWALVVLVAGNAALIAPQRWVVSVGWLVIATGNGLALCSALALVIRRGQRDLGGIADAAVIALAAGSVLWSVLPRRVDADSSFAAQVDLLVVVFALTGVLGALLRLSRGATGQAAALRWLLGGISLAIGGNILASIGGGAAVAVAASDVMFMCAFTAVGLFGLDPTGPQLMEAQAVSRIERLSPRRLAFLGIAVAAVPAVAGARGLASGNVAGLLLAAQGALVAAVVMVRIGLLAAQRSGAEQALAHQATHDPLTQLLNRGEFVARLREELSRGTHCSVLFCDLDEFKSINDTLGHDAGDRLLIDVADALRSCVRPPDMVSRFGGDEFVILLIDATPSRAQTMRDRVTAALSRPFESVGKSGLLVSIGIAQTDGDRDPDRLINAADHAMYQIKAEHVAEPREVRPTGASAARATVGATGLGARPPGHSNGDRTDQAG
jgi:diguanylate cyclase (GGDEF)-like protein